MTVAQKFMQPNCAAMTVEQILTALRLVAMGRPNHPDVVALAEYLAKPAEDEQDKPKRGRKPKADQ